MYRNGGIDGTRVIPFALASIDTDLADFVGRHGNHGPLTGNATEPTPNGYMVESRLLLRRHFHALGTPAQRVSMRYSARDALLFLRQVSRRRSSDSDVGDERDLR